MRREGREKKPAAEATRVVGEREYIEENVSATTTDYSQNTSRES